MNKFKKVILIIIILISSRLNSQWQLNYTMNMSESLNSLYTVDTFSVWGIGIKNGYGSDTSICYKMVPPGIWKRLPIPRLEDDEEATCIAATDTANAWFGNLNGKIYHTSDGGYNWTIVYDFGWHWYVRDIQFSRTNKLAGYANSQPINETNAPFKIIKTTNGGLNWIDYTPVTSTWGCGAVACVTDQDHYWTSIYEDNHVPKILFTTNSGTKLAKVID